MYIYKAGVVGAGTMGGSIAQVISFCGLPVVILDIDEEAVKKGILAAKEIYLSRVKKGKMTQKEVENKMMLITGTTNYDDFSDVDLVIEAVSENMSIKKKVFNALDKVCSENSIFASNTSALSISEMAACVKNPERVIGLHFFNPAHVMKLIEIIPGVQTSEDTIDTAVSFAESLRKIPIRVNECAGFLVNRLLMPYINEAFYALQEGAQSAKKIDEEMVKFGMPMGPFTLCDMLGLDVCAEVADILFESFGDRMKPAVLIREITKLGRLGTKTGAGVYNYNDENDDDSISDTINKIQKETGITKSEFSPERLILPMVNESVTAFQEGVTPLSDIDIAMMAGTGFPKDIGGPLHWADKVGLDSILDKMNRLKEKFGARFLPAPMIKRYITAGWMGVSSKKGFFDYN